MNDDKEQLDLMSWPELISFTCVIAIGLYVISLFAMIME